MYTYTMYMYIIHLHVSPILHVNVRTSISCGVVQSVYNVRTWSMYNKQPQTIHLAISETERCRGTKLGNSVYMCTSKKFVSRLYIYKNNIIHVHVHVYTLAMVCTVAALKQGLTKSALYS